MVNTTTGSLFFMTTRRSSFPRKDSPSRTDYVLTRWTLSQVMARALLPPSMDTEQAKFARRLLDKLKHYKEVLLSIRNASAGIGVGSGSGSANTTEAGGARAKPSKAPLRKAVARRNCRHSKTRRMGVFSTFSFTHRTSSALHCIHSTPMI